MLLAEHLIGGAFGGLGLPKAPRIDLLLDRASVVYIIRHKPGLVKDISHEQREHQVGKQAIERVHHDTWPDASLFEVQQDESG